MNSQFKFLHRVRIHGGECGAVARALHHEVKSSSLYQADSGKALESTIERKQMSIKITLKRIALVAVSALGIGMLSVVPVRAADVAISVVDSVSVSAISPRVGDSAPITVTIVDNGAGLVDGTDTVSIGARFLTDGGKPTGSSSSLNIAVIGATSVPAAGSDMAPITLTQGQNVRLSGCSTNVLCSTATLYRAVEFIPDVAGTYKVMVWVDADADGAVDAGEKTATVSMTTTGAPASVEVAKVSAGNPAISATGGDGSTTLNSGALYRARVKDAAGNVTQLTNDEYLSLSSSISTTTFRAPGSLSSAITSLANTAMNNDGWFYFHAVSSATAASTPTITVTATGGEIASGVQVIATPAFKLATAGANTTAVDDAGGDTSFGLAFTDGDAFDVPRLTSVTLRVTGDTVDEVLVAQVTDVSGDLTGYFGGVFTMTATTVATTFYASFPALGGVAGGNTYTVDIDDAAAMVAVTATANVAELTTTTISPSTVRAASGTALSYTGTSVDQFGAAIAGASISWSVSGATTVASTTKISDADGLTSFSYTAGTVGTDTVAATSATSGTVTVVSALDIGSVLLTTPHTTSTGVTEAVKTYSDIDAGAAGAQAGVVAATATVKDAAGIALAGVPVTFTVSGTTAAILSTKQTVYTGAAGTAATSVYGWAAGTYTVTAKAGAKSDDAPVNFAQTTATEARNIKASASGGLVTVTVTDRFGNGVYNAPVYATRTGTGNFAGASKTNSTTDRNGQVEFIVSGGDAEVTVSLGTDIDYGQSDATAGLVSSTTATDDFDAVVAGTTTAAEEGVGNVAAYTAAGNNSTSVKVTVVDASQAAAEAASDAAAEAIDAANAATDAANLAAEAADAATVAAEEARDAADAATAAVEELATQVATLMAALKAQITTLANTVAKIAKKVKA